MAKQEQIIAENPAIATSIAEIENY